MPALVGDIAVAMRDVVQAEWSSDTIDARYPSARDGSLSPAEGFFDSIDDAQTVIDARASLIGTERRRWTVRAADLVWPDLSAATPTFTLVDSEQSASLPVLLCRIEVDLEAERTSLEVYG